MKSSPWRILAIISVCMLVSTPGCLSWDPGWEQVRDTETRVITRALPAKVADLENRAGSAETLRELLTALEDIVKTDPGNKQALEKLGTYYTLMGYGYSGTKSEKQSNYTKGMQYCERVMYGNPDFKARIQKGENVWDAGGVLTKNELYSLYFWYIAVGSMWRECLGAPAKILNIQWPRRAGRVLEAMTKIDPDFRYGSIQFVWANYYAAVPGFMGGDLKKSEDYFNKAIAAGPQMIQFLTGRARYLQTQKKDRDAFIADLKAAIAIAPEKSKPLEYAWAVFHINDARKMLAEVDKYF